MKGQGQAKMSNQHLSKMSQIYVLYLDEYTVTLR